METNCASLAGVQDFLATAKELPSKQSPSVIFIYLSLSATNFVYNCRVFQTIFYDVFLSMNKKNLHEKKLSNNIKFIENRSFNNL